MSTKPSNTSKASASKMGEEEDLAVLIYKSSKTAKARVAEAAAAEEQVNVAASVVCRTTSSRKRSDAKHDGDTSTEATNRISPSKSTKHRLFSDCEEKKNEHAPKAVATKKYRYECSAEGCTNQAKKGGVCKKHGAKVEHKRCKSEGCTNYAVKGGVCIRHGATWTKKECSSEGCTNQVVRGGVCIKHGAKVKRCSNEGCTNLAKKGGL